MVYIDSQLHLTHPRTWARTGATVKVLSSMKGWQGQGTVWKSGLFTSRTGTSRGRWRPSTAWLLTLFLPKTRRETRARSHTRDEQVEEGLYGRCAHDGDRFEPGGRQKSASARRGGSGLGRWRGGAVSPGAVPQRRPKPALPLAAGAAGVYDLSARLPRHHPYCEPFCHMCPTGPCQPPPPPL